MKKEILVHLLSFIVIFILITFVRLPLAISVSLFLFWIGGLMGTFLPDIDHLIYVYLLRPHELTSQRATSMIKGGNVTQSASLLVATKNERQNMIFHTIWFQVIFLAVTVWVVMSSGNLFGWGLVLGFSLHLLIDQIQDYLSYKNLDNWFVSIKVNLSSQNQLIYILAIALVLTFLAFFS